MDDKRFDVFLKDAKYRQISKRQQKVKVDSRFQSMFKDKKFEEEITLDKRGRSVKHSSVQDLKQYYYLSSSDDSSAGTDDEKDTETSTKHLEKRHRSDSDESSHADTADLKDRSSATDVGDLKEKHCTDKKVSTCVKDKLKDLEIDYARGEQNLFSDSSSDEDDEEEPETLLGKEENVIDHNWGELATEAEPAEEITHRLAACNMDWDRVRAVDLMIILNSFLPAGGSIENVKIYTSEYGKKRLAEEEILGPQELRSSKLQEDNEDSSEGSEDGDEEEGSRYHMEKLRQYQLNRLKYYYAVVTFNSAETANKVYEECNGMEYESSSTKLDLRFIPNDMEFDDEPKSVCDQIPDMTKYQPRYFVTSALQQSKVNLTWDETDPTRIEVTQKLNTGKEAEIDESLLQNYLALSDEEENNDEDKAEELNKDLNPIEKYKALLFDIEEKEKEKQDRDIQMEITWGVETENKFKELVNKKLTDDKTPFEKQLDKMKEKRKLKKKLREEKKNNNEGSDSDVPSDIDMNDPYFAEEFKNSEFSAKKNKLKGKKDKQDDEETKRKEAELELILMNNEEDVKNHFSLKKLQQNNETKKKSKKNKKKENKGKEDSKDNFKVNVEDARFSAIYSSHHYNIDPSDPHFKKTEGMEQLIKEKFKRKREDNDEFVGENKKIKDVRKNAELRVLVKSVRRKTEAMNKK